jgi:hypothetical protein
MRGEINRLSKTLPSPDRSLNAEANNDSREADLDSSTVSTSHGAADDRGGNGEPDTAAVREAEREVNEKDISMYFNAEDSGFAEDDSGLGSDDDDDDLEHLMREFKKRK